MRLVIQLECLGCWACTFQQVVSFLGNSDMVA